MSLFQVQKPKSAGKLMVPPGDELQEIVVKTMNHVAKMVGATLGPGGKQVLIERGEMNMKPIVTKDGVTVIKHLGYGDALSQLVLETARDAAIRTATEAGDGTTTATILSASITDQTFSFVKENKKISPQRIVREMNSIVPRIISQIDKYKIQYEPEQAREVLLKIATLSANGDTALASAIIEAFDAVGDEGNITIAEVSGPSKYEVQVINGYTVDKGLEESCRNFAQGFINDKTGTMTVLNKPLFILFDGVISDVSQWVDHINRIYHHAKALSKGEISVVFVAHGFSDTVLGDLHVNWTDANSTIKIFPLVTPGNAIASSRTDFLYDLQAYTGCPVFNPIDRPLANLDPEQMFKFNRALAFEASRFRSSVMVDEDPEAIELRVEQLKMQRQNPESQYEAHDLDVRIGKLTSGIARLNIHAPSQGETREKRDRADDAWMSIRSTVKHGAIPGGGYALVRLAADLAVAAAESASRHRTAEAVALEILSNAFRAPVEQLYLNFGLTHEEISVQIQALLSDDSRTYDILNQEWVQKDQLLDSVPALVEAIRNSVSIASLLGTIGGIVAFKRDYESDKEEEKFVRRFETAIGER